MTGSSRAAYRPSYTSNSIFLLFFKFLQFVYVCVRVRGRVNFNVKAQCQWGAASWTYWSRCNN